MKNYIELNLKGISNIEDLHTLLAKIFGFPDFYGRNYAALVDCLTSIPYPEDGMTKIHLSNGDEYIDINIKGIFNTSYDVVKFLLSAIVDVNNRRIFFHEKPFLRIILE